MMPTADDRRNLPTNLRFLCQHKKSASTVARGVGINRQQFEKYLSGKSYPSQNTRHRLAEYFGISIAALAGQPGELTQSYRDHTSGSAPLGFDFPVHDTQELSVLRNYTGAYQTYFLTPAWPGRIYVGLAFVFEENHLIKTLFFNRIRDPDTGQLHRSRLDGRMCMRGERLFVLERTRGDEDRISETILFPTHRHSGKYMTGMSFGVSWRPHRMPFASRTIWRRAGQSSDLRRLISECGIYLPNAKLIDPIVGNFFGDDLDAYSMIS